MDCYYYSYWVNSPTSYNFNLATIIKSIFYKAYIVNFFINIVYDIFHLATSIMLSFLSDSSTSLNLNSDGYCLRVPFGIVFFDYFTRILCQIRIFSKCNSLRCRFSIDGIGHIIILILYWPYNNPPELLYQ
jgi:hypothetical protein